MKLIIETVHILNVLCVRLCVIELSDVPSGPVWVCVTLVFVAAVAGNVSEYLQTAGTSQATWHYDFHKGGSGGTATSSYLLCSLQV